MQMQPQKTLPSNIPMNFTGLPNMPVMPQIPQTTYIPPASSFIQPKVEEIVSVDTETGKKTDLPIPPGKGAFQRKS